LFLKKGGRTGEEMFPQPGPKGGDGKRRVKEWKRREAKGPADMQAPQKKKGGGEKWFWDRRGKKMLRRAGEKGRKKHQRRLNKSMGRKRSIQ